MTKKALAYWNARRGARAMPSRADIDPREMRAFLANLALLEPRPKSDGSNDIFVRLAGTSLEQTYGMLTGRLVSEIVPPETGRIWHTVFDPAMESASPVRSIGRMVFEKRSWLEVESLVMPLSNDGETVSMLMIVVVNWEADKPPPAAV
jgi:hypothetical protein